MKILFFVLAILGASAAGYFSWQTQEVLKEELTKREQQKELRKTRTTELGEAKKASDSEEEAQRNAESALQTTISEIETANSDIQQAENSIAELDGQISELTSKIDAENEALASTRKIIENMFPGEQVTFDNIEERVEQLQEKIKELTEQRNQRELQVEKSSQKLARARAEIQRQVEKQTKYQQSLGLNKLTGTVTAVNAGWGFVVINLGTSDGLEADRELLVVRNGQRLGRLQLASIERRQSIANIDYASLSSGVAIRPGDRVMLAEPSRGN